MSMVRASIVCEGDDLYTLHATLDETSEGTMDPCVFEVSGSSSGIRDVLLEAAKVLRQKVRAAERSGR